MRRTDDLADETRDPIHRGEPLFRRDAHHQSVPRLAAKVAQIFLAQHLVECDSAEVAVAPVDRRETVDDADLDPKTVADGDVAASAKLRALTGSVQYRSAARPFDGKDRRSEHGGVARRGSPSFNATDAFV